MKLCLIAMSLMFLCPLLNAATVLKVASDKGKLALKLSSAEMEKCASGDEVALIAPSSAVQLKGTISKIISAKKQAWVNIKKGNLGAVARKEKMQLSCRGGGGTSTGGSLHEIHEGGDAPYSAEINGSFSLISKTTDSTILGEDGPSVKESGYSFSVKYIFIFPKFTEFFAAGVGPQLSYSSLSWESEQSFVDTSGVASKRNVETTEKTMGYGVAMRGYFADLDRAKLVPFAGFEYLRNVGSSKTTDLEPQETTGNTFRFSGGVHFFLDSNVSLTPELRYEMVKTESKSSDPFAGEQSMESDGSGLTVAAGLSIFI